MSTLKLSVFQTVLLLLSFITRVLSGSRATAPYEVNGRVYQCDRVISQDISIVGGGSAGTYAAVRLQAVGKTVTLIEKTERLGGNTQTYYDLESKKYVDYGVRVWHDIPEVRNYAAHLNVSLVRTDFTVPGVSTSYFQFNTGELNRTYATADRRAAFGEYIAQASKYPFLDYGFDLPSPIPGDLLLLFGEFVKKWSLELLVPTLWLNTQGIGNLLQTPTIYVLKYFGISVIQGFQTGFLGTPDGDNSALYESATSVLYPNVLFESTILDMKRDSEAGVQIIVQTPSETVLVKSKKLVIAVQPLLADMGPFDLSVGEKELFGEFKGNEYFAGVLKNSGIPDNTTLMNMDPRDPYGIPQSSALYSIAQTGFPGLQTVTYQGATNTALSSKQSSDGEIQQHIIDGLMKLDIRDKSFTKPEFVASSVHAPFELAVSARAIENGFYGQLYGLQGQRNTWYTSATFHTHDSSLIWRFTEGLLANITAGI
ncbi:Beta-cyclopiazonate dehydrogenase [Lachnellula hyalina]|uniref:Beta-cyclopiazonate dehydrogenase n=1 Tax=Lachnellula hyalina TaxID=1316788 RepID=A0A8H8R1X3_9HELO|nr:Beta-cyclopiazonate dehydrogenase [Lachnellula hyalina]TVY26255.1 Beta-cyclopiazonate dehydrogenase [Lachnellula hyalina]